MFILTCYKIKLKTQPKIKNKGDSMYYTGFADEASQDLKLQIAATKELGWQYIESRNIGGTNIHNITDEQFDQVYSQLNESGIKINCFG